jgi:hypothetical protein
LIAAIAALGALVFNGCAIRYQGEQTHYQGEQTKQQVAESKKKLDDEIKRQARLVNIWPAGDFSVNRIHVTAINRSASPVYRFRIYITDGEGPSAHVSIRKWDAMEPCTQVTLDLLAIARSYPETSDLAGQDQLPQFDYGIMFTDADGQAWHRHAAGALSQNAWLEFLDDGTRTPDLPPMLRDRKKLENAQGFTVPRARQKYIASGPTEADDCT